MHRDVKYDLFEETISNQRYRSIEVFKHEYIEAIVFIVLQVFGAFVVFLIMWGIGLLIFNESFAPSEIMYSLFYLPLLFIIKDVTNVFYANFTKVAVSDTAIVVKTGCFIQTIDKLNLDTVENIEITSTPLGRFRDFGSITLYSYGSNITLPYVHAPFVVERDLLGRINKLKTNENQKTPI